MSKDAGRKVNSLSRCRKYLSPLAMYTSVRSDQECNISILYLCLELPSLHLRPWQCSKPFTRPCWWWMFSTLQAHSYRRNVTNFSLFCRNVRGKWPNKLHSLFPPIHNQDNMCQEHRGESIFISFVFLCYGGSFPRWTSSLELSLYESKCLLPIVLCYIFSWYPTLSIPFTAL